MCLAQFAISYQLVSTQPKSLEYVDNASTAMALIQGSDIEFPKVILLTPSRLGTMTLRGFEYVLRLHSSKKKGGSEFHYAEMMLYLPWQNETVDLHLNDPEACMAKFKEHLDSIIKNKVPIDDVDRR